MVLFTVSPLFLNVFIKAKIAPPLIIFNTLSKSSSIVDPSIPDAKVVTNDLTNPKTDITAVFNASISGDRCSAIEPIVSPILVNTSFITLRTLDSRLSDLVLLAILMADVSIASPSPHISEISVSISPTIPTILSFIETTVS